ncbi:MAG: hypothetical protein ACFE0P_08495 [Oceanicaulis sp.]
MTNVFAMGAVAGDADTGVCTNRSASNCDVKRDYMKPGKTEKFDAGNVHDLIEKKKVKVEYPSNGSRFKHYYEAELRDGKRRWVHRVRMYDQLGKYIKTVNTPYK